MPRPKRTPTDAHAGAYALAKAHAECVRQGLALTYADGCAVVTYALAHAPSVVIRDLDVLASAPCNLVLSKWLHRQN